MKILVVEDSEQKGKQVEALLRSISTENIIKRATSFIGATRYLEFETYDLLILDLVLPIRDGEAAAQDGGKKVLSEIVSGSKCRRPSHIICLTAFEEVSGILKDEAEKSLVHVVLYQETSEKWHKSLEAKARYVQKRLEQAELLPNDFNLDIGIVTSSPHVELREVVKLPGPFIGEYHQSDALDYFFANWKSKSERQLSVVACAAPSMGMTAACVTACKVIERWRPRFLVMTGIAAGTKKDQAFGDVLVAETAYDYGSGKITESSEGDRVFTPSPNQLHIDTELRALLQRWDRDQLQMQAVQSAWHTPQARTPRLVLGLLASGAAVVQDKKLVDEILKDSRKVVGLEMEAYAIFQAAHLARVPRPRVLVAKSVSDFANRQKSDKWQEYAAFTSARFVYEFFIHAEELKLGNPLHAGES